MAGHLLACLLFFSNMKLGMHAAQPDQQKFWYFDYPRPTYPAFTECMHQAAVLGCDRRPSADTPGSHMWFWQLLPVVRKFLWIFFQQRTFMARIHVPTGLKLGLWDILSLKKLMLRPDVASDQIHWLFLILPCSSGCSQSTMFNWLL